jgi:hypothetical protein
MSVKKRGANPIGGVHLFFLDISNKYDRVQKMLVSMGRIAYNTEPI